MKLRYFAAAAALLATTACETEKTYTTLPSGFQYMLVNDEAGETIDSLDIIKFDYHYCYYDRLSDKRYIPSGNTISDADWSLPKLSRFK